AADVDVRTAEAQLRSSAAAVAQARASLNQAEVNLANTVIVSPIDGIVMARSVDAGQTVAASMQAPTLFTLAADLSRMRVNANLDESDIGRVEAGQPVTFRVDAYPNDSFDGTVAQVRLQPTVSQNVVTYVTVINVANPGLRLKPGMTATVSIEIARRNNVLHVASPALRVRPTADAIAALGGTSAPLGAGRTPQPAGSGSSAGATLWLFEGGVLKAVPVRTGVSNGTVTEIVSGDVKEGDVVAASIALATTSAKTTTGAATTVRSPLMGGMPGPPPGGPR
ncbi:MAG: efflux RND transporter periplasmic adaptor subunit, partial [Acidobacteria bacterium]|nr:efflux RND transporter periplasmic adaptor subunit [Acidobacteriota bacterium]